MLKVGYFLLYSYFARRYQYTKNFHAFYFDRFCDSIHNLEDKILTLWVEFMQLTIEISNDVFTLEIGPLVWKIIPHPRTARVAQYAQKAIFTPGANAYMLRSLCGNRIDWGLHKIFQVIIFCLDF